MLRQPENWQDFEKLCRDLWSKIWNDKNAQRHGRTGQPQHGVDIYGQINGEGEWHGIQCKGKDCFNGKNVTEDELLSEVEKAKNFTPYLKTFTLATTAQSDVLIQKKAREITENNQLKSLFSVHVWSWSDISQQLSQHPDLINVYYPGQGTDLKKIHEELVGIHALVLKQSSSLFPSSERQFQSKISAINDDSNGIVQEIDKEIDIEINSYRNLIEKSPRSVIGSLSKLKDKVWRKTSNYIRFKILTNLGAAYLELGETDEAANLFIEAKKFSVENDVKSFRNLAYALLIRHDYSLAKEAIKTAISIDQYDRDNYVIYLAILPNIGVDNDFERYVPEKLLSDADIIFALGQAYLNSDDYLSAFKFVKQAYEIDNESSYFCALYGCLLLENITNNSGADIDGFLEESQLESLNFAHELLEKVWGNVKHRENRNKFFWIAINLCIIKIVLKKEEVKKLIYELELAGCTDLAFCRVSAQYEFDSGDTEKAFKLLQNIPEGTSSEIDLFRIQMHIRLLEFAIALEKTNKFIKNYKERGSNILEVHVKLLDKIGGRDKALELSNKYLEEYPDDPICYCLLADMYLKGHDHEKAKYYILQGSHFALQQFEPRKALVVADILFDLKMYDKSAEIYNQLVHNYNDSHVLRRLILSFYNADMRNELLEIFEKIPVDILKIDFYLYHSAAINKKIGKYGEAIRSINSYLLIHEDDLSMRVNWIHLNSLLENNEIVIEFLKKGKSYPNASVVDQIDYAYILARYGFEEQGLQLAYNILRNNQQDFNANVGYIQFVLKFHGKNSNHKIVGGNSAFIARDDLGKEFAIIVESDSSDKVYQEELPESNSVVQAFWGKKIGDVVRYSLNQYENRSATILRIESKFRYIARKLLSTFEILFPNNKVFWTVNIKKKDDSYDFSPLFEQVDKKHDFAKTISDIYINNQIPISLVAHLAKENPFEIWNSFSMDEAVGIKSFEGGKDDIDLALSYLKDNFKGIIVDPLSAFSLGDCHLLDVIHKNYGKIGITQSTLDFYRMYIETYKTDTRIGSMSKCDSQYGYVQYKPDDIKNYIYKYEEIYGWLKDNCLIIPSVTAHKVDRKFKEIQSNLGEAFSDTLFAASGSKMVLLSDDMNFRNIAAQQFDIKCVWTQLILLYLKNNGYINRHYYSAAIEKLMLGNLKHTILDSGSLLLIARRHNFYFDAEVSHIFRIFESKNINISYSLIVALQFIYNIMIYNEQLWIKKRFILCLLNALLMSSSDNAHLIIDLFWELADLFTSPLKEDYIGILECWHIGHLLPLDSSS
mgnify:CR=1 FL=1